MGALWWCVSDELQKLAHFYQTPFQGGDKIEQIFVSNSESHVPSTKLVYDEVVPTFKAPCHEESCVSGGIAPGILKLITKCKWSVSCPGRSTRENGPRYPLDEARWAPEPVWKRWKREIVPAGNRTPVVQAVTLILYWPSYPDSNMQYPDGSLRFKVE
jgi:hypothetical protein